MSEQNPLDKMLSNSQSSPAVGIDLGTSNSAVAGFLNGQHQVLADERGQVLTPSIVLIGKDQKILVGNDAKSQMFKQPHRAVHSIKRLIGRKVFHADVKKSHLLLPFKIVEGADQMAAVEVDQQLYSPQELSAFILKHMKNLASQAMGCEINRAVVTVPAHFNDHQRQATKDACQIAGLETLRMINEPTAAALAYGFGKSRNETVVIYDLGGGTFDISILRLHDKVFEVIGTAGDPFLGGDDFDDRIIDLCAEDFLKKRKVDLRKIPSLLPILRMNAEKAKRKLAYAEKTDIFIPSIAQQDGIGLDLQFTLTRETFESACHDLIQRTFAVCDEALAAAKLKPQEADAVILVGGPTKMSLISDAAGAYFGKTPLREINPDEVVAIGASIQAQTLTSETEFKQALLLDVTPLDLGIATVGGFVEALIEANTPIPIETTRFFTTTKDMQTAVDIRIFQGKDRREESSTLLGAFQLTGFKSAKAGDVQIEVTFTINADGIVEVRAHDPETNVERSIQIKLTAAMSEDQLRTSSAKSKTYQEVRLKSKADSEGQKVLMCIPSPAGPVYEEGYVKNLNPLASEIEVLQENFSQSQAWTSKKVSASDLAWVLEVENFADIPLYLENLTHRPATPEAEADQNLYEIEMKTGVSIYGRSIIAPTSHQDGGIWVDTFADQLHRSQKCFVYSGQILGSKPVKK